jgi:signal transduction histidine kinase
MASHWRLRVLLGSVRMRTTLASGVVVACALALGGVAFVALLRSSLTSSVQDTASQRASAVASALRSGAAPREVATSGEEDIFVQIQDSHHSLLKSSDAKLDRAVQLQHPGEPVTIDHIPIADGTHSFRVVERDAKTADGLVHVAVGASLEHVNESTRAVTRILLFGIPGLLAVVVLTTWLFTGRALHPVESIRREVAAIKPKDLERRVRVPQTGDEIARLSVTMNEMLERLADFSVRQRRFISDASHELRSPLTTIRHHAEVAMEHPEVTDVPELSRTVLTEEERLETLVDDLLVLAHADEHTLARTRQSIDLDDLVLEEAARLRATSDFRIDTTKVTAAKIEGDVDSLRRALRNVTDNAMRHARSRIAFEVSSGGGIAKVVVLDDGAGIPTEDRMRIFERFTRLGEARDRDSGGSGLGLSIVSEIMTAHDGSVAVGDGPGARFELRLPAAAAT